MNVICITVLTLLIVISVKAEDGENCCPGIALKPVTPDTCASGAENGTMCVGNFFADCKCVKDDYELDGFQYCSECRSSASVGGVILIIVIIISPCIACCCIWYFCCKKGRKTRITFIDRRLNENRPTNDFVALEEDI